MDVVGHIALVKAYLSGSGRFWPQEAAKWTRTSCQLSKICPHKATVPFQHHCSVFLYFLNTFPKKPKTLKQTCKMYYFFFIWPFNLSFRAMNVIIVWLTHQEDMWETLSESNGGPWAAGLKHVKVKALAHASFSLLSRALIPSSGLSGRESDLFCHFRGKSGDSRAHLFLLWFTVIKILELWSFKVTLTHAQPPGLSGI